MVINKAQEQTFSRVGIYLEHPYFSHRQLFIAFSRVRFQDVKVEIVKSTEQGKYLDKTYTKNVQILKW